MENFFKKKLKMLKLIINDIYFKKDHKINIYNTEETLKYLIKTESSISRFGDGEFNLINGISLKFQRYDKNLSNRLKNILSGLEKTELHIVAIPYSMTKYSGYTWKSIFFWTKYFAKYRKSIMENLNINNNYFDAQITRIYINRKNKNNSIKYFDMWKCIWKNKNILIVEGKASRFGVGNDLFENTKSVRRIICPIENAFDKYDEILNIIQSTHGYDLVLLVLGPTATVMAYDLAKIGIRAIDSGNMDMEYEWMKQQVKSQVALEGKYTLEAINGTNVIDINDENYEKQIIARVGC
ncbi:SP_1767 family glycosyltransferase [Clostridium tertium]